MKQEHGSPPNDLDSSDCDAPKQIATKMVAQEESGKTKTTERIDPEKDAIRHLKRQLKQQSRIRKYEMRWSQALGRNDTSVANSAQSELRAYLALLQDEPSSCWYQHDFPSFYQDFLENPKSTTLLPSILVLTSEANESSLLVKSRRWMTQQIWQPLVLRMILPNDNCMKDPTISTTPGQDLTTNQDIGPSRKQLQTIEARSLLNHMTKGTQTETMFQNDAALIGYTRQKFMERALLAFKSLNRLHPQFSASPNELSGQLWQQLLQVRSILSIGCGPGCDTLGVLAFLKHYRSEDDNGDSDNHPNHVVLDRIVWMDYVMPQWKRLVLDHLTSLLTAEISLVSRVEMATCDVRYSLCHDERNHEAWKCLIHDNNSPPIGLIVVSYLLTETRGQWIHFFQDLFSHFHDNSQDDDNKTCLLLLSEPKAWQLHTFTTEFAHYIDGFQWLDSSRDCPDLQPLERRLGPAVLLLRMKQRLE